MEQKEVIYKIPIINHLDDNIHYDVDCFMDETDCSIGDVLEKLPGIRVFFSGQILYQDKEISKFYIDGLDLLQGKYGLPTQNEDTSKVASVQILENHQPVKALKGMEIPENATINLKLKQSAMGAFFTTAQLGAGYSIGKSIDAINSEARLSANYDRNQSVTLHQGVISGYSSGIYSLSPDITADIGRLIIVKYGATYRQSRTKIRDSKMEPIHYFTQDKPFHRSLQRE